MVSTVEDDMEAMRIAAEINVLKHDGPNKVYPLHTACEYGRAEMAEIFIIQSLADVESMDKMGRKPIHYAGLIMSLIVLCQSIII